MQKSYIFIGYTDIDLDSVVASTNMSQHRHKPIFLRFVSIVLITIILISCIFIAFDSDFYLVLASSSYYNKSNESNNIDDLFKKAGVSSFTQVGYDGSLVGGEYYFDGSVPDDFVAEGYNEHATKLWNAYIKAGVSPEGAAGMMGNQYYESSFVPFVFNGGGSHYDECLQLCTKFNNGEYTPEQFEALQPYGSGAFGLAQWMGDRKLKLAKSAIELNKKIEDLEFQAEYVLCEISLSDSIPYFNKRGGDYSEFLKSSNSSKTPRDLAFIFSRDFESWGGSDNPNAEGNVSRCNAAEDIYNKFMDAAKAYAASRGVSNTGVAFGRATGKYAVQLEDGSYYWYHQSSHDCNNNVQDPVYKNTGECKVFNGTMAKRGCGIYTVAMALSNLLGRAITPLEVATNVLDYEIKIVDGKAEFAANNKAHGLKYDGGAVTRDFSVLKQQIENKYSSEGIRVKKIIWNKGEIDSYLSNPQYNAVVINSWKYNTDQNFGWYEGRLSDSGNPSSHFMLIRKKEGDKYYCMTSTGTRHGSSHDGIIAGMNDGASWSSVDNCKQSTDTLIIYKEKQTASQNITDTNNFIAKYNIDTTKLSQERMNLINNMYTICWNSWYTQGSITKNGKTVTREITWNGWYEQYENIGFSATDCSGAIRSAYDSIGISNLPQTTSAYPGSLTKINSKEDLAPGDILHKTDHVAMFIGWADSNHANAFVGEMKGIKNGREIWRENANNPCGSFGKRSISDFTTYYRAIPVGSGIQRRQNQSGSVSVNTVTVGSSNGVYMIGDSRTVRMAMKDGAQVENGDEINKVTIGSWTYQAKVGKGLSYMKNYDSTINNALNSGKIVVIAMGANDLNNIDEYIRLANKYGKKGKVYYTTLYTIEGRNDAIVAFNKKLKEGARNYKVIDVYKYFNQNHLTMDDGVHATMNSSKILLEYIKSQVK